jgi:hypothetical protein
MGGMFFSGPPKKLNVPRTISISGSYVRISAKAGMLEKISRTVSAVTMALVRVDRLLRFCGKDSIPLLSRWILYEFIAAVLVERARHVASQYLI